MRITFASVQAQNYLGRTRTAFADAALVFAGVTIEIEDTRKHYGETRIICYGLLEGRMVVMVARRVARIATYSA